jgi:hypothetical protein
VNNIFISSTYEDLSEHRKSITYVLTRMKRQFSAMEFFGSRADEAMPVCREEIEHCNILVGVYAWRYGWIPTGQKKSITEQEFDYAKELEKICLCYIVSNRHPWPPVFMDKGEKVEKLEKFKVKVSKLVRSNFTTPDNLAKQVAADVAREIAPSRDEQTVGGLLQINWDSLAPDLQQVFLDAYKRAKSGSRDGVVSTRHVISAMASLPNSSGVLLHAMPDEAVPEIEPALDMDNSVALAEVFGHNKPFSHCVLGSLQRLLPSHSPGQRLLAIELASDILKNGQGKSVEKFRRAGVDAAAVSRMMSHAESIAKDTNRIRAALNSISDSDIALLSYSIGLTCRPAEHGKSIREELISAAIKESKLAILAGELMRRNPELLR